MKIQLYIFILISACIILFGCRKDEETDKYYTNLKDVVIEPINDPPREEQIFYNLDIDKDKITDITIILFSSIQYHNASEEYISIFSENGYEIKITDIPITRWSWNPSLTDTVFYYDTVTVPTIFNNQDFISINGDYWQDSTLITYKWYPSDIGTNWSSRVHVDTCINMDYKYIILRNLPENKLVWLKIKVNNYSSIVLSSYRYFENIDETIIEDL